MCTQLNFKKPLLIFVFTVLSIIGRLTQLNASGGEFFIHDKMEHVVAASYNFMVPIGDFADAGRGGNSFGKIGHGFELEYMYYVPTKDDENLRVGFGASIPFYFLPINGPSLNSKLSTAFNSDPFGNSTFKPPKNEQWFSWGLGGEVSALYTMNKFSLEGTLKVGKMFVYPPGYKLEGGSYVPPNYSSYFPNEGNSTKFGESWYVNAGLQLNYFFSDHVGMFAGASIQYMNPTFQKDLLYLNTVNNEPTIERQQVTTNQSMTFLQFKLGIFVHIPY